MIERAFGYIFCVTAVIFIACGPLFLAVHATLNGWYLAAGFLAILQTGFWLMEPPDMRKGL